MNLVQAASEILCLAEAGNPALLISGSGIGKSSVQYQQFLKWKAAHAKNGKTCGYGQIFAATHTPPDFIGYQFKGTKTFDYGDGNTKTIVITEPSVPLWMISDEGKPAFMYDYFWLCIDEYGQGEADTKRCCAEVFLNGGTSPWYLPQGSVRVGCSNEGTRMGVTKDFDFCIARRFQLRIEGNVKVLVDHMTKPYTFQGREWLCTPFTKAWVEMEEGGTHVFEDPPKEQGPFCNPRQLMAVDRYVQRKTVHSDGVFPLDGQEGTVALETIAGAIGMPAAAAYVGAMKVANTLPPFASVVADPENALVPTRADLMLLMIYQLAAHADATTLPQCIKYLKRDRVPQDMSMTFVINLLRRDYKGIINHPAMKKWVQENGSLVSIVTSEAQRQ